MPNITRRDFLQGSAVAIAAGIAPIDLLSANSQDANYPPVRTGLRGSHPGSFEVAHALGREGQHFDTDSVAVSDKYDLIVVGAGISGLSAAFFYRERRPNARILIVDNHDDFGGHAKRNEFHIDGRMLLSCGGAELMMGVEGWSDSSSQLLKGLKIDVQAFDHTFDWKAYHGRGLSRGVYFNREDFGVDKVVAGDPSNIVPVVPAKYLNGRAWPEYIAALPFSSQDRSALLAFHTQPRDYLSGMSGDEKIAYLAKTSYRDYLTQKAGLSLKATQYFGGRTLDFFGGRIEHVAAGVLRLEGYPGFAGLGLPDLAQDNPYWNEPWVRHFPDGNASIARSLVRALIPAAAPGKDMYDITTCHVDYSKLDRPGNQTCIRLNSTAVKVRNIGGGVDVGYVRGGRLERVAARHCVMAGWGMMSAMICPELPEVQRVAMRMNVKLPLVYNKVLIRNWQAFANAGVYEIGAPMAYHSRVMLDYPTSIGSYRSPSDPSEPMVVHMGHVPHIEGTHISTRDRYRAGRALVLGTTFDQFEQEIRSQLNRMLGGNGFDAERDIRAITVNRWPHGYSYSSALTLGEDPDELPRLRDQFRKRAGNIAVAGADAGWSASIEVGMDEAARAVDELTATVG
jgi:spermidine dehydrogenase